jgi:DNA processing protein
MRKNLRAWVKIARARLPDVVKQAILDRFPDPNDALVVDLSELSNAARKAFAPGMTLESHADAAAVDKDCSWLGGGERGVIGISEAGYPPLLRQIPDPPLVLYTAGNPSLLGREGLAIVGSRNPTPIGREIAHGIARQLSTGGAVVVSGLATGIDGAAHYGALEACGSTVAVCATGLDVVYPRCHAALADRVYRDGLLISEYPPGTGVRRYHFPHRNRLISGLTLGTLIIEAASRSGSLITARLAAEQGRDVFAVPGSIHSPLSRGPHLLIRDGARLVESINDIYAELPSLGQAGFSEDRSPESVIEQNLLLQAVDYVPTTLDQIVERSGLTITKICAMLIKKELSGEVRSCPGGYIRTVS